MKQTSVECKQLEERSYQLLWREEPSLAMTGCLKVHRTSLGKAQKIRRQPE